MTRSARVLLVLPLACALAALGLGGPRAEAGPVVAGTESPGASSPGTGRQMLTLQLADDGLHVLASSPAARYATTPRGTAPGVSTAAVVVADDAGRTVRRTAAVPLVVRAELPVRPGGRLTGRTMRAGSPVFRVIVPADLEPSRIVVRSDGRRYVAVGADARPSRRVDARRGVTRVDLPGFPLGPMANRLNVVILGDGYTQGQHDAFVRDAADVADSLFATKPYSSYRDSVNVLAGFAVSDEAGADHPAYSSGCSDTSPSPTCCPDSAAGSTASFVSTRYDSTYCSYGIERLLVPTDSERLVNDADLVLPDWDQILVVVNDPEYGGSGGAFATTSRHASGVAVMKHELGHSLLGLDDEYTTYTPGYPPCSDEVGSARESCLPNITDVTDRSSLKWRRWVDDATPVPTSSPRAASVVGLFRGGHYSPDTWYRPCDDCLMRSLGRPMGAVESEQLPLRLFSSESEGGFGLSLVDLGSASPLPSATVGSEVGSPTSFAAKVVSEQPGPATHLTWSVDGTPVVDRVVDTGTKRFTWSPEATGTHTVSLTAVAQPGTLHADDVEATESGLTWTVDVSAGAGGTGEALGPPKGRGKRYARPADARDCSRGSLAVRLGRPAGAARARTMIMKVDGTRTKKITRRFERTVRLPLPDAATRVDVVVRRVSASALTVSRRYDVC
ncbi:M64 family metallopeptidase [Nocardioides acrostichi]|uniref:IgA peptidase M64 n=1 Tax=Nocardioides acrostichi TaxID=2784339 RepID=A0A930UXS6_9ACTN|nr:M64 family metallopeptidase [Nocardioides acrostichi]MBF4160067.1 hypothetical protein [Nocardioides acrostichi]